MNLHQRVLVAIIVIITYCSFIIFLDEQLTSDIHVDKFAVDPNDIERDIDEILNPPGGRCEKVISVLVQFLHSSIRKDLAEKLYKLMFSIITGTKSPVKFYFITDEHGEAEIERAHKKLKEEYKRWRKLPLVYYNIKEIMTAHKSDIEALQEVVTKQQSYYDDPLFVISPIIHRILPAQLECIIMLDVDIQIRVDVRFLYNLFAEMENHHIMGLAREQQPVYRHLLTKFREEHKGTIVGDPPPHGKTGFNSGTKLINLKAMRSNLRYNNFVDTPSKLRYLVNKYYFHGHLGDQDIFTLLSFETDSLFYILPCQWNRQLCTWWRDKYPDVFDQYFNCSPPYFILHGNCDTKIRI